MTNKEKSMKQFYKYIITLTALLCITIHVWAAWAGSGEAVEYENGTYYVYYDMSEKAKAAGGAIAIYFDPITLNGPGSKVEFEAKKANWGTGNLVLHANNGTWKDVWSNGLTTSYKSYSQSIDNDVTQIQFYMPSGSLNKTYKSLKVTMAQYIENPSKTTLELDSGKVDDTNSVASFTIPWCNVPAMTYTIEGSGSDCINISVAHNSDLGKYNTATFKITYDRTKASNLDATLTINNSYGNYSKTIKIIGSTSKYDQTLSWNNESAIETNMQLGKTQTVTATATSGLAVTYSSSDNRVLTVDASGKITAVGIGNATITASQAGNYKYNAVTETKYYTVWNKNTPIFTPNGFNEANVCHLKVGDKVTLEVLNVSDDLSGDFKVKTDNNILGITRNGNTITIEALNAGTADAIFTQTENNDIFGAEKKYQFSVSKINNTLAIASSSYTKYVDDEIPNIISFVNSDAAVTTSSSDATIAYFDVTSNKIFIPNSEAKSFSSKTITITIAQAETYKYTAAERTITLTVNKHTPVFTLNPAVTNSPEKLYFNKEYPDYFTTNANTPLTITSSDTLVAKWVQGSNSQSYTLKTFSKTNTATLTAIQHENYYWQRWEGSVDIKLQNAKNHVQIDVTESDYKDLIVDSYYGLTWNNGGVQVGDGSGGLNYDDKYIIIQFEGIPDSLFFNAVGITSSISSPEYYIQQGTSKDNLSPTKDGHVYTKDYNAALPLDSTTRCVKICYSGNFGTVFKNVRITERKEFYASEVNTTTRIKELNFNKDANGNYKENKVNDPVVLTFDFQYANIGHDVVLSTNDSDHFTITPNRLKNLGGEQTGRVPITVTYKSTAAYETENSKLYIEDELNNKDTIELTAITTKKDQSITWNDKYNNGKLIIGQEVADAATATSKGEILYSIANDDNSDVIEIINGGAAFRAKAPGTATIIATQVGNDEWNSVTDTKEFTVTTKTIQYIHWTDNLTRLVVGGGRVQLTATAQILLDAETENIQDAPERTALITYQSANENVVTINGSELTIVGEGETIVTATLPGDDIYEATSISMPVRVRVPSTTCDSYVLEATDEFSIEYSLFGQVRIYEPIAFTGPGYILTFEARKNNSTAVGNIQIQQYVNGEWKTIDDANPDTDWRSYYYELDRNATKIRFYNGYGSYYRYFKNILVTQATYLETTTNKVLVEKSIVGDEINQTIAIQYSNIPVGATITNSSNDITISSSKLDSDCGKYGEQIVTIIARPSAVGTLYDTVTVHDEITGSTLNIPITIHTQLAEQNLYWDVPTQPIASCSDLQLPTSTTGGLPITWSVTEGGENAALDVNGNLLIYATGNVTLKAENEGNAIYAPFSQTYTIPVAYTPIFLGTEDNDWNNPSNWSVCHLPSETDVVTVQESAVLEEHVTVGGLIFNEGGSMQILSKGGLTVGASGITGAKDDGSSIIIDNTPQGAGFLKVNPETTNKPAKVTVNYSTEAYNSGNPRDEVWQYMGAPGSGMVMSDTEKTTIYHWNEVNGWVKQSGASLTPFVGYAFTQNMADSATFTVTATPIIPTEVQEIELTVTPSGMGGSNLFVNSFLAPIDLANFTGNEFEGEVDETFYLFNSGSWKQWQSQGGKDHMNYGVSPGQYYALSPNGVTLMDPEYDQTTIPPMQGVYVIAREKGAKIKLDYGKHVYAADASNQPMRAPQRISEDFKRVRLHVNSQNSGADRMYVIQHEAGTAGYDNGYDARNMAVNGQVAIYTHELEGQMEISVSDKIDSIYIGFRAGSDSEYTLRMTSVVGEEMYLKDLVDNILIPVMDGQDYTFSATPNSVNDTRFLLLGQKSGVATDIETVHVYIHDNMVHVMQAPENSSMSISTVGGVTIANYSIGYAPCTIDLLGLPTGVYVLRINDKAYKFVCK